MQTSYYKVMADVLLTAFNCGASRIAVFHETYPYSTYQGDWHQDIAHQDMSAGPQATLSASYQQVFEHVFMYLVNGLDAIKDADGSSALDNSLIYWGHECGFSTHDPWALPIVMAGKASGYFKTGMYVDYRNQIPTSQIFQSDAPMPGNFAGLTYPQFLATALYSMGIKASGVEAAERSARLRRLQDRRHLHAAVHVQGRRRPARSRHDEREHAPAHHHGDVRGPWRASNEMCW